MIARLAAAITVTLLLLADAAPARNIHFFLVSDTADASIGQHCKATVENISGSLAYLIPQHRYSLTVWESDRRRYDADSILAAIANTPVARDDTFVFLFDGHGARAGGRHFLYMPDGGRLWSAALQDAVRRKPCNLRVILTSSCNVSVDAPRRLAVAAEPWDADRQGIAPVMEELFLNHSGLMHMNGAWPEQFGFTNTLTGSWLFDEFFTFCTLCPTGRPTWRCIDRRMDRRLQERFRRVSRELDGRSGWTEGRYVCPRTGHTQTTLHTITWSLPQNTPRRESRFGVAGDDGRTRTGVTAVSVAPDGPAGGTLRIGDVIVRINGEEVEDAYSFFELVRSSSRTMHFEFRRHGTVHAAQATLRW